jgi:hypothetical protein
VLAASSSTILLKPAESSQRFLLKSDLTILYILSIRFIFGEIRRCSSPKKRLPDTRRVQWLMDGYSRGSRLAFVPFSCVGIYYGSITLPQQRWAHRV